MANVQVSHGGGFSSISTLRLGMPIVARKRARSFDPRLLGTPSSLSALSSGINKVLRSVPAVIS